MRLISAVLISPLFLNTIHALPNPFHRCHTIPTKPTDLLKPIPTSDLLAGVLTHASPAEIASIVESNSGDLGGELPMQRTQQHQVFEEDQVVGAPIVKVRRSFWSLLGWREWVVSVEWRVPRIPAVFTLEVDDGLEEVGWELEDAALDAIERPEQFSEGRRQEDNDDLMEDL